MKLFLSGDEAATWQEADARLDVPHVRWLAPDPTLSGRAFAGTGPAAIS